MQPDVTIRDHVRPCAAICNISGHVQPCAARCSHTHAATCSHTSMYSNSTICGHGRPYGTHMRPDAAMCSHMRPRAPIYGYVCPICRPRCAHSGGTDFPPLPLNAAMCAHIAATCGHVRPYAAICGHVRPYAIMYGRNVSPAAGTVVALTFRLCACTPPCVAICM